MVKFLIEVSANFGEKWKCCEKTVSLELEKCYYQRKNNINKWNHQKAKAIELFSSTLYLLVYYTYSTLEVKQNVVFFVGI